MEDVSSLLSGLNLGRGGSGGGGGGGGGSDRHNIGRVPELDYFARKLAGHPTPPKWLLPYGKAGDVAPGGLPDVHASRAAYLTAMQAHTALEFQAAAASALEAAEGKSPQPAQLWWPFALVKGSVWRALPERRRSFQLDFTDDGDPWVKNLVHVKETDSYHIATMAKRSEEGDDILALLPTVEGASGGGRTRRVHMRSLGFIGSFLLQFSSAQALRFELHGKRPRPGACHLLELAADPRKQQATGERHSTLRGGPLRLLPDVPVNAGQRAAVAGLRGGLSVIHGPPGTGKSTTIFHIIESRVQPKAQVVVTATRNQAIDAVVTKLARVEGSLLVFGRKERLGPNAQKFLLAERVARHPHVLAWLDRMTQLQKLRDGTGFLSSRAVARLLRAALAPANSARPEDLSRLQHLLERVEQGNFCDLVEGILNPAANLILATILPAVKAAVTRSILESTRVYACTIDSTPRMVSELTSAEVELHIDTVIVDEAGCVSEMALPTLINLAPSQLVLIGDHLQLPSYTDLHKPPPNHTRSLMQRAVELGLPAALLSEQYRMHPAICAAISREFYGGRLVTAAATAARRAVPKPCRMLHVQGEERWHPASGYDNAAEAFVAVRAALKAAKELRNIGVQRPVVFIISMYNKQRDLITRLVETSKHGAKLRAECASCQVLSVDACQGDEADAVIVSTVRNVFSSKDRSLSSFFRDRQRINVALSRARHLCVVCGHRGTLTLPKAQPWGRMLGSYSRSGSLGVWQAPTQPQPAPRPQEACPPVTLTPSGAGAAFASFIYPTWPVSHQKPADKPPKAPKNPKADQPVDEEALWGYVPALDPRGLQRGLLHLGDPARLRRALYKLLTGERTVVAAVGGSISVGRGSATQGADIDTKWPSYLEQYAAWLQTAFPQAAPQLVNKAQSGSTSNIFDACAEAMVPKDADIVIAEFAMNDGTQAACKGDGSGSVPARASFERLIRKLQALPNKPAVIVMDAYSFVRGAVGSYLKNAENDMSIIAAYYGLPVLSVRAATFHQMLRNQHGYKVDRVRQETLDSSAADELFLWDISHPYGPTGHRYMAELLIGLTQMTAGSLQTRPLDEQEHFISAEPLPPPVIPGNYDKAAASCVMNRAFEGVVVEKKGFKWVNERPDAKNENDEKWGWIGEKPGDYVVLGMDSRSSGDASGSGRGIEDALLPVLNKRAHLLLDSFNKLRGAVATPLNVSAVVEGQPDPEAGGQPDEAAAAEAAVQSQVLIGHLASYQGMGRASVECISGCACEPSVLDGWWERHASLQVMHTIRVSEHPECRIKLTVLDESTGKGKAAGRKVKLMAALVLAGTSTEGLSKPGKLAAISR